MQSFEIERVDIAHLPADSYSFMALGHQGCRLCARDLSALVLVVARKQIAKIELTLVLQRAVEIRTMPAGVAFCVPET